MNDRKQVVCYVEWDEKGAQYWFCPFEEALLFFILVCCPFINHSDGDGDDDDHDDDDDDDELNSLNIGSDVKGFASEKSRNRLVHNRMVLKNKKL